MLLMASIALATVFQPRGSPNVKFGRHGTVVCYTAFRHKDTDGLRLPASDAGRPILWDLGTQYRDGGRGNTMRKAACKPKGRDESRPICPMPVASVMPRPHSPIGGQLKRGVTQRDEQQPFKARTKLLSSLWSHQPGSSQLGALDEDGQQGGSNIKRWGNDGGLLIQRGLCLFCWTWMG